MKHFSFQMEVDITIYKRKILFGLLLINQMRKRCMMYQKIIN